MNLSKIKTAKPGKLQTGSRPGSYHSGEVSVAAKKKAEAAAALWAKKKQNTPALGQLEERRKIPA